MTECEFINVKVTISGYSRLQDGLSLYNKIGWELGGPTMEKGPGRFVIRSLAEEGLREVQFHIWLAQKHHAGTAKATIKVTYIKDGRIVSENWSYVDGNPDPSR